MRHPLRLASAALLLWSCAAFAQPASDHAGRPAASQADAAAYQRALADYLAVREPYEAEAKAYWTAIAEKRRIRFRKRRDKDPISLADYVTSQPPVYSGPSRPVDPSAPAAEPEAPKYVPVVADFLASAKTYFGFVPRRPRSESEYKKAYAAVAAARGLTHEQVVRIYAFESGGDGNYDVQAGLEYSKDGRALSTALGYNQLLHVNSLELMAEKGDRFIAILVERAAGLKGAEKAALEHKIAIVRRMIAFSRTVPDRWKEHQRLADTPKGLGIHAMNLDIDVGPLLQTQKLEDSIVFARRKGHLTPLTAAELEMMNLTGDGNGFDIVTMPEALRAKVPTANFFHQRGYERNRVAVRNNVVSKLLAATNAVMDRESKLRGAREMAAAYPHAPAVAFPARESAR